MGKTGAGAMVSSDRSARSVGRRAIEPTLAAAAGAALGGLTANLVGVPAIGAAVGAANGLVSGWRRTYDWKRGRGRLAFVLDSTWALPTTAAAVAAHALGALRGRPGYVAELSERQNRHVYGRGFQIRPGFATTFGNVITGAGDTTSGRRARLVTDHEDVHVWQSRWFGPLFPVLYGGWLAIGGIVGAVRWCIVRPRPPFTQAVESVAYYSNPFEHWAYSRDGTWPPPALASGFGPRRPLVRPFRRV